MPQIRKSTITKYLSALKQIRSNIVELGNNKMSLSGMCRDLNLSKSAATEIIRGGLVKNLGTKNRGAYYQWNTILPNEKMARELINRVNYRSNEGMIKTRSKRIEDVVTISKSEHVLTVAEKDLTLSEKIVSAFPNNTLLEIKLAIDKLLTDKVK